MKLTRWKLVFGVFLVALATVQGDYPMQIARQVLDHNIAVVGITTQTSFREESDPKTAKIGACIQRYWQENIPARILHRAHPGVVYALYTEYESGDFTGGYTYLFGEEVTDTSVIPDGLQLITIPAGTYVRVTTQQGPVAQVVLDAWQKIWQMTPNDLGGKRQYRVDFERYDERALDLQNTIADVYVGIEASK